MPILDLNGAKPIEGMKQRRGKRTFGDTGTVPAGLTTYGGGGGGFAAGKVNKLSLDFIGRNVSADQDLFGDNFRMRARARVLAADNPFASKYLAELEQNVVSEDGIQLQAKVTGLNGKQTAETRRINQRIEQEFRRWSKRGRCTADGQYSFRELQRLAIRTIGAEGEMLLKFVYGREFNDTGFALQLLDNDQLDDSMVQRAEPNEIRMGVEVNTYHRPVRYHLYSGHPSDMLGNNRQRVVVPAEQLLHTFVRRRPNQTRGYTWMAAAMMPMNQLARYDEAVIVASRAAAAKFFAIEKTAAEGEQFDEDDGTGDTPGASDPAPTTANAGEGWYLEEGEHLNYVDPRFPTNNHRDYLRTCIRLIATGLGMDYPTLGNDLEGVNFSSIRAGLLDMRDCYRLIARWFIEYFMEPIFQAWLRMALLTTLSDISLSPSQMDQIEFVSRGWPWVDPMKDAQANALNLQNGLALHSVLLAEQGYDFEEFMTERAAELRLIKALGLVLGTDTTGVADTATDSQTGDDKEDDDSGAKRSIPFLRVLSVEQRTPQQIEDAREAYRTSLATRRLELPAPEENA